MFSNIFEPQYNHYPRRQYAYPQANNFFGSGGDAYDYNPYFSQRRRRHPNYYTEDELIQMQKEKALRQEKLLLQRRQEEQRKQEAEKRRQEQLKQRQLFLIRAKMATRIIQRAWRAYRERRDEKIRVAKQAQLEQLRAKQEKAAFVITRAVRNFGPIHRAKQIANSLRRLQEIQNQVESVDPATAVRKGSGISLFEHTIDKLIAQVDLIDSYGDITVRSRRKAVVMLATERVSKVLEQQQEQQQQLQQQINSHADVVRSESSPTSQHMDDEESEVDVAMDTDMESMSENCSESLSSKIDKLESIAEDKCDSDESSSSEDESDDQQQDDDTDAEMFDAEDEVTELAIPKLTQTLTDLSNQLRERLASTQEQLELNPTSESLNTRIQQVRNALQCLDKLN